MADIPSVRRCGDIVSTTLCWPSCRRLEKKTRYRVIIDASTGDWFDRTIPASPRGLPLTVVVHAVAKPLMLWVRVP
jgi:hypothetical protein